MLASAGRGEIAVGLPGVVGFREEPLQVVFPHDPLLAHEGLLVGPYLPLGGGYLGFRLPQFGLSGCRLKPLVSQLALQRKDVIAFLFGQF